MAGNNERTCEKPCEQDKAEAHDILFHFTIHHEIHVTVFSGFGELMVMISENFLSVITELCGICRESGHFVGVSWNNFTYFFCPSMKNIIICLA